MREKVNLVEREESALFGQLQLLDHAQVVGDRHFLRASGIACLVGHPGRTVDQVHDGIRVRCAAPRGFHHRPIEPALGHEDARRIDQHDLRIAHLRHAAHGEARRLHLVRHDGDLGADEAVGQCGLARIRRADNGGKTCAGDFSFSHCVPVRVFSSKAAALRSASRLEDPVAIASPWGATCTSIS